MRWLGGVVLGGLASSLAVATGDPQAAARQYQVACRLAAAGAPEARAALAAVVELDPAGPLADDALLDQALTEGLPSWPERIGRIGAAAAARALAAVERVIRELPQADRADEARYRAALLRIEPLALHDRSAARVALTALATSTSTFAERAQYALAWLNELEGHEDRAFDGYQRLLVDAPQHEAGVRALVGAARVLLRRGAAGEAAQRLQQAIDGGASEESGALALRELAVRTLLRQAGAIDASQPTRVATGIRALAGFAPTATGGVLVGDRRLGVVVEFGAAGERVMEWPLEDLQVLAADPGGGRFAAAGSTLYRLDDDQVATPLASLDDFAPLAALATDGLGSFWLLERKGRRVGHVEPGAGGPVLFWQDEGTRLTSIAWDGRRLVALDGRADALLTLSRSGEAAPLTAPGSARASALSLDRTGRIALEDARNQGVRFLRPDGHPETAPSPATGLPRPVAFGLGPEGELHLFDRDGGWMVFR